MGSLESSKYNLELVLLGNEEYFSRDMKGIVNTKKPLTLL